LNKVLVYFDITTNPRYYDLYLMSYKCLSHNYLNLNICWDCFILVFYFTILYTFLIFYQLVSHIVVKVFSYSFHSLLIFSSRTPSLLQIKDLRVGQWKEPCIGLTQENSIENFVQDCLLFMAKMLYRWNNGKLEKKWWKWKSVSPEEKSWRGGNVKNKRSGLNTFLFLFFIFIFFSIYFSLVYF